MCVGGKIVGEKKIADLEELRDGFAVIASDSGGEVLRGLDASGGGFDGEAGNGDGSAGTSGIGVENFIVNHNALRGVGSERRGRGGNDGDRLYGGCDLLKLEVERLLLRSGHANADDDADE